MISAWNLIWIVPVSASVGFFVCSAFKVRDEPNRVDHTKTGGEE